MGESPVDEREEPIELESVRPGVSRSEFGVPGIEGLEYPAEDVLSRKAGWTS